jgi:hypothetical protein
MDLTFEREDGAQADSLATHVEAFTRTAADAFEAADEHALFNEAADYARAKGLRAYQMSQILGRLHRHPTAQAAARAWSREGSVELGEVADQARVDAVVNEVLQEHTAAAIDWPHADLCRELKVWFEILNKEFFGGRLPPSAISIERTRRNNLGWYRLGRDGLALRHRINLNALHVRRGPALRISTLAHEMIHEWEEVELGRSRGGSYHTAAFRQKSDAMGIPTDEHGHDLGIRADGPLAELLRRHGVPLDDEGLVAVAPQATPQVVSRARLVKWRCGCTNIWASRGIDVQGECRKCGKTWDRSE